MAIKILIVDDEPAIIDTLSYALRAEGFDCQQCTLGSQALKLLDSEPFDFVVLDVGLPDMSGFEVCKELRRHSQVPVLFLTARNQEVDRIVGLELGADDYVTKPFSPREIISRIRAIQRRIQPANDNITPQTRTGFTLDRDGQRIACNGHWLNLTRYEYLLLATLLERRGRILSRAQIMDSVWQDDGESMERTVDTHIKTLRKKLKAYDDKEFIITHRGLGYSLAQ